MVGAHLDAKFFHPTRSARNHLRLLATEAKVPAARVDEVLSLVGLAEVARKKPKGFSLGMGQRLGLAGAILAEPQVLLLDEPANGLDPQSIQWLRDFLRHYARQGNVVFVSSHLLSEMQLMAEHLVVIAKGRMVADESLDSFVARSTRNDVLVRCTDPAALAAALAAEGITAVVEGADGLAVTGADTDRVGDLAFRSGIGVRELTRRTASLEDAFLELTSGEQEFRTGGAA
jgi:ABC-2 type transport system ATP-binding protein